MLRYLLILSCPFAPASAPAAEPGDTISAAQYLSNRPRPMFKAGHTLPRLTRFGWTLPFEARVELAKNWGYALEFGGYAKLAQVSKTLADPASIESRLCKLAAENPKEMPLGVILDRDFPKPVPDEFWIRDDQGRFTDGKNFWQDASVAKGGRIASPESPDEYWKVIAAAWAQPLKLIRERAPIAIVLNGGEYAMGVAAAQSKQWELDPRVRKARGEMSWFEYSSQRKARQETIIADGVRKALPDRQLYIYYNTSSESHRNRYAGWDGWAYDGALLRAATDLPSFELYYRHFNSGWTGPQDALTLTLNAVGYQIARGSPLSYNWLCAGWPRKEPEKDFSELPLYVGFIKCFYAAGMVGGNAGYYAYPKGGFGVPFAPAEPPHWLRQMEALAHVHALFSHLEIYLREGELLPGPDRHKWSKDQPAYEMRTGDPNVRVLARKLKSADRWLIVAWAADGKDREIAVSIGGFGELKLNARAAGSVYVGRKDAGRPELTLVDVDPMQPSAKIPGQIR